MGLPRHTHQPVLPSEVTQLSIKHYSYPQCQQFGVGDNCFEWFLFKHFCLLQKTTIFVDD